MEEKKINGVLIFAIVGLVVATGAFFITFITTQKAQVQSNKYQNLQLKNIQIPSPKSIPPLKGALTPPVSTYTATLPIASVIPSVIPSSQSAIIASPSAESIPSLP